MNDRVASNVARRIRGSKALVALFTELIVYLANNEDEWLDAAHTGTECHHNRPLDCTMQDILAYLLDGDSIHDVWGQDDEDPS